MKLPAFQFYPGDWLKDPNLRRCTHASKGVWIDILCLMFESEQRGVLETAGRAWSDEEIALAVGGDQVVVLQCIYELTLKGVANRQPNGALFSKRLVRDEHKRQLCVEAGKRGGNPNLQRTLKGDSKGPLKGDGKGESKRKPTPSSSSSTSVFKRPSVAEVEEYGATLVPPFSRADDFIDHYESNGWKVGKSSMKDWKASVRKWHRTSNQSGSSSNQSATPTLRGLYD